MTVTTTTTAVPPMGTDGTKRPYRQKREDTATLHQNMDDETSTFYRTLGDTSTGVGCWGGII